MRWMSIVMLLLVGCDANPGDSSSALGADGGGGGEAPAATGSGGSGGATASSSTASSGGPTSSSSASSSASGSGGSGGGEPAACVALPTGTGSDCEAIETASTPVGVQGGNSCTLTASKLYLYRCAIGGAPNGWDDCYALDWLPSGYVACAHAECVAYTSLDAYCTDWSFTNPYAASCPADATPPPTCGTPTPDVGAKCCVSPL